MDAGVTGKRIAEARKKKGMTQEELALACAVTAQAVSKWENGHNLPDIENLLTLAEVLNVPYVTFLEAYSDVEEIRTIGIRGRFFKEENMFTRMRTSARAEKLDETYRALAYMRERHLGQYRKGAKFSSEQVAYINHPLLMACQAYAFGIRDDALLAAILLHDVVEDTGVTVQDLPFSDRVKQIVDAVTFRRSITEDTQTAKKAYYAGIQKNGDACLVKVLDRCNNLSTMSASFTRKRMKEYIRETEEYIIPMFDILKNEHPEYSEAAFLTKYHMVSVLETIKNMMLRGID